MGLDPSTSVIEAAREHSSADPATAAIEYIGGMSVEEYEGKCEDDKFDAVCILEVLEHTDAPQSLISSASKLLKEDGLLFVSTINKTVKSNLLAVIGAEHLTRMIPPGTHDWSKFLGPGDVRNMCAESGLREVDVKGMVVTVDSLLASEMDATKFRWKLDGEDFDVNWIGCYSVFEK